MLLTEEEYRKKWCPHVRYVPIREFDVVGRIKASINRWIDRHDEQRSPDMCNCIASDCSQWRWGWSQEQIDFANRARLASRKSQAESKLRPPKQPVGFCGLAGKP